MPENNTDEIQYELDENYEPLAIVDKADGTGTTWPELVAELNRMNQQIAALTQNTGSWDSRFQTLESNTIGSNEGVPLERQIDEIWLSPGMTTIAFTTKDGVTRNINVDRVVPQ